MARTPTDKHDERRRALAESALTTLGELGYARTSLREIANHSEFSHGVVHYYFDDKFELIVFCVRYYKAQCVHRYDDVVASSSTADGLVDAFADKLVGTILDEAPMHRLWYDLRAQAMFEDKLRDAVLEIDRTLEDMIWRVVERYSELAGQPTTFTAHAAYAVLDGVFQQGVLGHLEGGAGAHGALERMRAEVRRLVPLMLAPRR
jgi:TetR/AcrR family transcriptional regulator, transcriptional repressor of bet genes